MSRGTAAQARASSPPLLGLLIRTEPTGLRGRSHEGHSECQETQSRKRGPHLPPQAQHVSTGLGGLQGLLGSPLWPGRASSSG